MAYIIQRVRAMVGDASGQSQTFSDQQIQDWLDERRQFVRYAPLEPRPTPTPNTGVMQYLDYFATCAPWEEDAQLFGPAWQPLSPATSDVLTGHWIFATTQIPTVWIVGKYYDLNGSAADLCEAWAAQMVQNYDFATQGRKYARSQAHKAMLEQAKTFRARQRPIGIPMMRDDLTVDLNVPRIKTF